MLQSILKHLLISDSMQVTQQVSHSKEAGNNIEEIKYTFKHKNNWRGKRLEGGNKERKTDLVWVQYEPLKALEQG